MRRGPHRLPTLIARVEENTDENLQSAVAEKMLRGFVEIKKNTVRHEKPKFP